MDITSSFFKRKSPDQLSITGDWVLANHEELKKITKTLIQLLPNIKTIDFDGLKQMDTNGAYLLIKMLGAERLQLVLQQDTSMSVAFRNLLLVVLQSSQEADAQKKTVKQHSSIAQWLSELGKKTIAFKDETIRWLSFLGAVMEGMLLHFLQPRKWRFTSVVAHIDASGFQAVPIIFLLNFLVGAVVAFLGATVLQQFGATIFTVHLIGFAFMREFGVLLTAILIAGRTASAFTAHIGSMRLNEETDALKSVVLTPLIFWLYHGNRITY